MVIQMNYKISDHAMERFIERGIDDFNMSNAERILDNLLKASRPVQPCRGFQVRSMLNNRFRNAKYRYANGWVFVISSDSVVLTAYKYEGRDFTWFGGKAIGSNRKGERTYKEWLGQLNAG